MMCNDSIRSGMKTLKFALFVFLPFCLTLLAQQGEERLYVEQYASLHKSAAGIKQRINASLSEAETYSLNKEMLALTKLLHRVSEGAAQTNLERLKEKTMELKSLLAVVGGAEADCLTLRFLENYLSIQDKKFIELADSQSRIAESLFEMTQHP
jgi:hypothetical protein